MKKRILSIVLTLCMVLMFVPQTVFAEGAGGSYSLVQGTNGAGDNEGPGNLIDGTANTKWCVTNFKEASIIFKTSTAVNISGYSITTGNDNENNKGRNPKNWMLYGCNNYKGDSTDKWVAIHRVSNDTVLQDENNTTYHFVFDKTETAYQYYKLEITAIQGGNVMQMSEFALTYCDHNWNNSVTNPACTEKGYTTRTCTKCHYVTISNYTKPLGHDISSEDGKCKRCNKTKDEVYTFNISEGSVIISDDEENPGKIKVQYGNNLTQSNIDPNDIITVTGETIADDNVNVVTLKVETAIPVKIKASELKIDNNNTESYAMLINGSNNSADVTLILEGNNIFNGGTKCGITVGQGRKLTIEGEGTVNAISQAYSAGIGGDYEKTCGTIIINGGTIYATGGLWSAGIGSGSKGDSQIASNDGTIIINGGTVTAYGGGGSAGIGGGYGLDGGNIIITGGEVIAVGGNYNNNRFGAGIGGGCKGAGGNIIRIGGTVNATAGGSAAASIGHGQDADSDGAGIKPTTEGNNNNLEVYGTLTLPVDLTIPTGKTLTIPTGKTLTIPTGKTLTIPTDTSLTISEGATLTNYGTINNNGKIYVDGTFTDTADNLYYPLTLEDASATDNTSVYNNKTYGKAGSVITLTPDIPTGYKFTEWSVSPTNAITINSNNKFTMPNSAIIVAAKWVDCTHDGDSEIRDAKPASCTEEGYTGDTYCLVCGAKISTGTVIAKSAHIDKDKDHLCDICGATVSEQSLENIPAKEEIVTETVNAWEQTVLRLQSTASKTSIKLKWNEVPDADGYVIYWNKCGAKNGFKQVKVIENGKTLTWTHKALKKNTWNKYYVKAYKVIDGKRSFIKTSNRIHLVTKGGKYTNVKKLKSSASKITLKKGKTKALKITQVYAEKNKNIVKHMRELTYTSSDKTVATVTSKGVIKARGAGSCYIYITAHSGVYTRVKVTVK